MSRTVKLHKVSLVSMVGCPSWYQLLYSVCSVHSEVQAQSAFYVVPAQNPCKPILFIWGCNLNTFAMEHRCSWIQQGTKCCGPLPSCLTGSAAFSSLSHVFLGCLFQEFHPFWVNGNSLWISGLHCILVTWGLLFQIVQNWEKSLTKVDVRENIDFNKVGKKKNVCKLFTAKGYQVNT